MCPSLRHQIPLIWYTRFPSMTCIRRVLQAQSSPSKYWYMAPRAKYQRWVQRHRKTVGEWRAGHRGCQQFRTDTLTQSSARGEWQHTDNKPDITKWNVYIVMIILQMFGLLNCYQFIWLFFFMLRSYRLSTSWHTQSCHRFETLLLQANKHGCEQCCIQTSRKKMSCKYFYGERNKICFVFGLFGAHLKDYLNSLTKKDEDCKSVRSQRGQKWLFYFSSIFLSGRKQRELYIKTGAASSVFD